METTEMKKAPESSEAAVKKDIQLDFLIELWLSYPSDIHRNKLYSILEKYFNLPEVFESEMTRLNIKLHRLDYIEDNSNVSFHQV